MNPVIPPIAARNSAITTVQPASNIESTKLRSERDADAVGRLAAHFGANIAEMESEVRRLVPRTNDFTEDKVRVVIKEVIQSEYTRVSRFQNARSENKPAEDQGTALAMQTELARAKAGAAATNSESAKNARDAILDAADLKLKHSLSHAATPLVSTTADPAAFSGVKNKAAQRISKGAKELHEYVIPNRFVSDADKVLEDFVTYNRLAKKANPGINTGYITGRQVTILASENNLMRTEKEFIFAGNDLDKYHTGEEKNLHKSRLKYAAAKLNPLL